MFDKYKERWTKLEEDHESIRKAKAHVEKYQVVYVAVGSSLATMIVVRTFSRPQMIMKEASAMVPQVINNNMPVFNNTIVNNAGHLRKIVEREDGKLWPSITDAALDLAQEKGLTLDRARWLISRCVNGHEPHVYGVRYSTIGVGTTG